MEKLRIGDVELPSRVIMGPGLRGISGEGYWFHLLIRLFFGNIWKGMVFAAKTTTMYLNKGNLKMRRNGWQMRGLFPRCIIARPISGHLLNAVGLTGPGFQPLLETGRWQKRKDVWILSFMAVRKTPEGRIREYRDFVNLLKTKLPELLANGAKIVLQLNFGCPNTENPLESLRAEIFECLRIARATGLPVMLNFNPLVPTDLLVELEQSGLVDCFWLANTIPYDTDDLGRRIFGTAKSPLLKRGFSKPGGISGPLCQKYYERAARDARAAGIKLPIIVAGVNSEEAARRMYDAGASAIALATVAILRPWRVKAIVKFTNELFAQPR